MASDGTSKSADKDTKNERTRPLVGAISLLVTIGIIGGPMFFVIQSLLGDWLERKELHMGVYPMTLLGVILLLLILRMLDSVLRGNLTFICANTVFGAFPTFREALRTLKTYYEKDGDIKPGPKADPEDWRSKTPFAKWMINVFVPKFENNVEAFAYWGAGLLIVVVGLRGIKILGPEHSGIVLLALLLEFTLISLLGFTLFFKPEDNSVGGGGDHKHQDLQDKYAELAEDVEVLKTSLEGAELKVTGIMAKLKEIKNQ
jgi:hypothetical protein